MVPPITIRTDREGKVVEIDPETPTLGFFPDELLGCDYRKIFREIPVERLDSMTVAMHQQGIWRGRLPIAANGTKEDDTERFVSVELEPLLSDEGISGYIARLEEELYGERAREERLLVIGIQTGQITHDLKNIFHALQMYKELLIGQLPKSSGRAIDIERNIAQLLHRGNTLCERLAYATSRKKTELRRIDLNSAVAEEAHLFSKEFLEKRISYKESLCEHPLYVYNDPIFIHQLFSNLIKNATEAITPRRGTISIATEQRYVQQHEIPGTTATGGIYAITHVKDTGCGISQEHLARIFEPQFTTKDAGCGFGLSTVYTIVKKNGGFIIANSQPNKGTHFTVALPQYHTCEMTNTTENTPYIPKV